MPPASVGSNPRYGAQARLLGMKMAFLTRAMNSLQAGSFGEVFFNSPLKGGVAGIL